MEIKNRHIVITGATRGIGQAFAKICAQDKAHLYLVGQSDNSDLLEELKKEGAKSVTFLKYDLRLPGQVDELLQSLKDINVDILFNNAGVMVGGLFESQDLSKIQEMFQLNINALIHLTHGVLPGMLERKRGKIINNASILAYMHLPCASTYAASKAAVAAFTDCLRLELKETGVSTLLLLTPPVNTSMMDEVEEVFKGHLNIPLPTISSSRYAMMIREAVLSDLTELEPSGWTGMGLKVAKFAKPLFEFEALRRFKRK